MTNEERDLITQFVQRVGGKAAASGGFAGSVPSTALPPVDPEADALLADLFARYPEARYRITQVAFVQEHAVAEASNQIAQLQSQIRSMQSQQAPAQAASPWGSQQAAAPAPSRGLFGGLFGGSHAAPPPQQPQYQQPMAAPQPQYAPGYQPGMFQRSGSGFLGSALTTAAGVAGGMMAANALSGLFSGGHHDASSASFGGGGFAGGGQQSLPGEAAPWGAPGTGGADPLDQGGDSKSYAQPDQSGWQNAAAAPADTGWQDASAAPADSGWADSSSGGSDFDNNT